jgi:argininosuccinate lyase
MGLWGGRFSEPTDDDLRRLNDSIGFDQRLYAQDIRGSIAYASAIAEAGVITSEEAQTIINGLKQVESEFKQGAFEFQAGDEDIHTAVERRLIEIVGAVGGKLHTGRSRNDQVATDFRLWVREATQDLTDILHDFMRALIAQSEQHLTTPIAGFTHLQPAQPITVAHWLMSFFWMLERDVQRLEELEQRVSVSPLGSGALAGTPLDINRAKLASALAFNSHSHNSLDAVSDRDFVAEMLFDCALIGIHLSRLAEDVIIYSNPNFGFITLHDRYSTGSSLMPQKRNADPMELARGKSGRLIGHLTGLMTTLKGLPSGYNKDLQEDKEAVFDAVDTLKVLLPVMTAIINTLQLNEEKMRRALSIDMLATDLADYLVAKGMPFREAHHVVGQLVQLASDNQTSMDKLSLDDYQAISGLFADDVYEVFNFDLAIKRKNADGGTAPEAVKRQIEHAKLVLVAE